MSYSSLLTKSWIDVFCKIITAPIHEVGLRNRQYSSSTNTWASHLDQALDGDRGTLLCRDAGELGFTSWMEESESRRQMEAGGIHVSTPVAQRRHRTPGSQMGTPEPGAEKRSAPWRWEWSLPTHKLLVIVLDVKIRQHKHKTLPETPSQTCCHYILVKQESLLFQRLRSKFLTLFFSSHPPSSPAANSTHPSRLSRPSQVSPLRRVAALTPWPKPQPLCA